MDKSVLSLRDEQSARDRRLPLGDNPRGAPGRVHGGIGEGECGGGCEVCFGGCDDGFLKHNFTERENCIFAK